MDNQVVFQNNLISSLQQQRNAAHDQIAQLAASNALLQEAIKALAAENEELKKKISLCDTASRDSPLPSAVDLQPIPVDPS